MTTGTTPRTPCRLATTIGCLVIGAVHAVQLAAHGERATYLGMLFAVTSVVGFVLAWELWTRARELTIVTAGGLATTTGVAYLVSRTVGLPGLSDVGHWTAAGNLSLAVSTLTVIASVRCWRRTGVSPPSAYPAAHDRTPAAARRGR